MAIKLLAFDLDGTIVMDDQKTITEKSIEAISYAKQKGVVVAIATGRIASGLPKAIEVDKYIDYVITANGAKLHKVGVDKPLYKSGLDYKKVDELAALAEKLGIFFELYCDGMSYALRKNKENIDSFRIHERFYELLSTRPIAVDSIQELADRGLMVEKFNMLSIPFDMYIKVWDEFSKVENINQVSSIKINIEINSDKTSKWNAIESLCTKLGISTDEVMTIGDSGNDYEMIKKAGLGVCMGNGFDEVKGVSNYVTDSIENDGFYKAVKMFI